MRSAPSLLIPIANLLAISAVAIGIVTVPFGGVWVSIAGAAVFVSLASLRALRLLSRWRNGNRRNWMDAWLVAATYDLARALALVSRASHGLRRRGDA